MKAATAIIVLMLVFALLPLAACSDNTDASESISSPSSESSETSQFETTASTVPQSLLDGADPSVTSTDNASDPTEIQTADLGSWLSEYEYLWSGGYTASGVAILRMHELHIYQENGRYYATLSVNGWQTGYSLKTIVEGDSEKVSIIYDSKLSGSTAMYVKNPFDEGDVLFSLKKTDAGIEVADGIIAIADGDDSAIFRPVEK
jgi:hypothetical protein